MSNMSYCRFENTARDLQDCLDAIQNGEINDLGSQYEVDALEELLDLCKEIVAYKDEIEDAIDRIFDGSFGVCQETQKPIKKNRLKVVPFTRFSLEGQNLYEKRKRKNHDNGGGIFATISDSTMGQDD